MPINVFGNISHSKINGNKIDTSLFVQQPFLRTNYIEANIEEDNNMKNQFEIKNLPCPQKNSDSVSKSYLDNFFNDSIIIKNTEHIDLNDGNITNARFIQVNQWPHIDSILTAKLNVGNSIDEPSIVRKKQVNDSNIYNLANLNSISLKKPAEIDNEVITKAYVDQFHQENERSRRDLGIDFYKVSSDSVRSNQDNDLNVNKLTNLDGITVNRNPNSDNDISNKKYVDDQLDRITKVRFIQTLQNYLKVSFGNDTYNLSKYDKIQITDTATIKAPNNGGYLLQNWVILRNHKNGNGKISSFFCINKNKLPNR